MERRLSWLKIKFVLFCYRNFQTFENVAPIASEQAPYTNVPPSQFGGSFLDPSQSAAGNLYGQSEFGQQKAYTGNEFDDEPPLLEGKK